MKSVVIIPARYASSRYPGKPLVALKGSDGVSKTLIQRTYETGKAIKAIDAIYVATDDERIADVAKAFGAEVVMTSESCRNGTERCAEAIETLGIAPEIVVNLQGDAPLTPPWFVEDLVAAMEDAPAAQVATPVLRCDAETLERFVEDRHNGKVGGTTAVFDRHGNALYFSKEVIPYLPTPQTQTPVFHHVGVYAYRPAALKAYIGWPEGPLEHAEGLEQLRFLENGTRMICVEVDARGRNFWELNNPIDVERIESVL